ncbi:MAG: excinuclease ABC subunit A [Loktanella sp.]|nr:excinuclease ABC subunit A [Loktanella sp.]
MKSFSFLTAALIALSPLGQSTAFAQPAVSHCPPGLAKKNPPCVPPGQARTNYGIGDMYTGDRYLRGDEQILYGLPRLSPGESYYRIGDRFLRVDDDTRLILEFIDVLAANVN